MYEEIVRVRERFVLVEKDPRIGEKRKTNDIQQEDLQVASEITGRICHLFLECMPKDTPLNQVTQGIWGTNYTTTLGERIMGAWQTLLKRYVLNKDILKIQINNNIIPQ